MEADFFYIRKFFYPTEHGSNLHKHPFYEFKYYLRGSGVTQILEKSYSFAENQAVLIPPGTYHNELCSNCPGELFCITFYAPNFDCLPILAPRKIPPNSPILHYCQMIYKETAEQKANYDCAAGCYLNLLLTELYRFLHTPKTANDSLDEAETYINAHFHEKLNLSNLSAQCGYSYEHFRHIFKLKFGLSPQNYLVRKRLESAKQMLITSPDIRMVEVAEACGFSDSSQLSTMFCQSYGISPKKFQMQARRK